MKASPRNRPVYDQVLKKRGGLRDLAPEGVCDPPNPWIYEQLARLCDGAPSSGGGPPDMPAPGPGAQGAACFTCRDIEDPNERPYIWDLKEDDCKCQ
jgi:hypothetical protein